MLASTQQIPGVGISLLSHLADDLVCGRQFPIADFPGNQLMYLREHGLPFRLFALLCLISLVFVDRNQCDLPLAVALHDDCLVIFHHTAHHFADAIRAASGLPFLDMVAASVARARELSGGGPVGILGSPALRRIGVVDRACAGAGPVLLWPRDEAALRAAIAAIKAGGSHDAPRAALRAASAELLQRGARVQLVACTEFSLVADPTAPNVIPLDTLDILVKLIRDFAMDDKPATSADSNRRAT